MSGVGRGLNVGIRGTSGNLADISPGNAQYIDGSFRHLVPLGKFRLSNVTATQLPNASCSLVIIRNPEGNGRVWVGGAGNYVVQSDLTGWLYETELRKYPVRNANELSLIAENNNTDVTVEVLTNEDIDVSINNPGPLDNTAPTVSSVFPAAASSNIERNTDIYAIFSEELDSSSINNTNITISPAISYTVSKDSINPLKVNIIPSSQLAAGTAYTITLTTGLKDLAGNFMAAPFPWTFTTKSTTPPADTTPPTLVSSTPANNVVDQLLTVKPAISFSEDLLDSSVSTTTVKVFKDSTNSVITVASITHSTDGKTITLTLGTLEYSTKYRIELTGGASGIKDLAGNALASTQTLYFTTAAQASTTPWTVSGNTEIQLYSGNYTEVVQIVVSKNSKIYNNKIIEWSFELAKVGSPTGTLKIIIMDSSNNIIHTFTETLDVSTLTTSYVQKTLKSPNNSKALALNYKIAIQYSGGDGSNYVKYKYANNSSYDSSYSYMRVKLLSFYFDASDADVSGSMKALSA